MERSRSCRIPLVLMGFFFASNIFICNGKVQFTCTYRDTYVLNRVELDYNLVRYRSQQLIAAGYKLVSIPKALEYKFVRDYETSAPILGKCYNSMNCDQICSLLPNTYADQNTGKIGNCVNDDVTEESFCTCCALFDRSTKQSS
ncbi:hypothetical protein MKX03_006891 [Papaver bracteatum]|nr:hypothetical protein MKX03_006891 [Papaver bracteatum]